MTELLPVELPSLTDRMRYAEALSAARLVPGPYRGRPADVLLAVELGYALRIAPVTALSSVHVIDGKPSMSAELMRALVLRDGHVLHVVESTAERCVIDAARREQPDVVSRFVYDVDDARRAGLLPARDGSSWDRHPRAMLLARCSSYACRALFPDVLAGVSYTPDELGATVDDTGAVVVGELVDEQPEQLPPPRTAEDRTRDSLGLPRRDERPATPGQLSAIGARLGQLNVRDAVHRRQTLVVLLGLDRQLSSSRQLTSSEASRALDATRDQLHAAAATAWQQLLAGDVLADDPDDDEPTTLADVDPELAAELDDEPDQLDVDELDAELAAVDVDDEQLRHDEPPTRPTLTSDRQDDAR